MESKLQNCKALLDAHWFIDQDDAANLAGLRPATLQAYVEQHLSYAGGASRTLPERGGEGWNRMAVLS